MFLQRSLFVFLFIFIILIIIFTLSFNEEKKDAWLSNLPVAEQKLYKLEMAVARTEKNFNATLAPQYYQERETYCNSFQEQKEYIHCMQRTVPWWGQKFKERILKVKE